MYVGAMSYRPVVVEVGQLVGESLHVVWLEPRGVLYHVEVSGRDSTLSHRLTDEEEIIPAHTQEEKGRGREKVCKKMEYCSTRTLLLDPFCAIACLVF